MKVMKFGGTSVGSPDRMKSVAKLIRSGNECNLAVLSAMSGTTNSLVEIADYYSKNNVSSAKAKVGELRAKYAKHVEELYATEAMRKETMAFLDNIFTRLLSFDVATFSQADEKEILSKGEIMSTNMMTNYMREQGIKVVLLSAFDFMRIDENREPDQKYIREHVNPVIAQYPDAETFITQGFICLDKDGSIDNLERGGSDYTASLLGAAVHA